MKLYAQLNDALDAVEAEHRLSDGDAATMPSAHLLRDLVDDPQPLILAGESLDRRYVIEPHRVRRTWTVVPMPVPDAVDAWALQVVLAQREMLDAIEMWVSAGPVELRLAWRIAGRYSRRHPLINSAAAALGLAEDAVDDLFRDAARQEWRAVAIT